MEIVKTSLSDQSKAIDSLLKDLKGLDLVISKKKSRYQSEYNALQIAIATSIESFFENLNYEVTVTEAAPQITKLISGKYKAVIITFKTNKNSIQAGTQFYCVNTFTEKGSIKTKEVSPDKLKLAGIKYTTETAFDKNVNDALSLLKIDPTAISFMKKLYDTTAESKNKNTAFPEECKRLYKLIKPQDLQAIGKDFGEILSARWLMNQSEFNSFEWMQFPAASNEPLIDFSIKMKNSLIKFSAKFEKGAAPSINAIVDNIKNSYPNPTPDEKKYIYVLESLSGKGVSNNILEAMKHLKTAAYTELEKIIKSNFNLSDLSSFIRKNISEKYETTNARVDAFNDTFGNVLKLLNKTVTKDSLDVVFRSKTYQKELASPIVSPMGYYLVDLLNKDEKFKKILNNIANSIDVRQIYLDFTSTSLDFEVKKFSDASFSFAYGANAKDSNNTGIKFKMIR